MTAWPGLQQHENRQPLRLRPCSGHVQSHRCAPLAALTCADETGAGAPLSPQAARPIRPPACCAAFDLMRTPIGVGDAGTTAFQPGLGRHSQSRTLPSRPRHRRVRRVLAAAVGPPPAREAGARARDRSRRPKRRRRFGSREPGARGLSPRGRHIFRHPSHPITIAARKASLMPSAGLICRKFHKRW